MTRAAVLVASVSAFLAFAIAMWSFGTLGASFGLDPDAQFREAGILAAFTFVGSFVAVTIAAPWLGESRRLGVRFMQGASLSLVVFLAVVLCYAKLNYHSGSFIKLALEFAVIALQFGGFAIPLVSGGIAVLIEAGMRAVAQQSVLGDGPASRGRPLI